MNEVNPYAPPAEAPPELPKAVESGIADPTKPAWWANGLAIAAAILTVVSAALTSAGMDIAVMVVDGLASLAGLAGLVLFLVWTYRVVRNARLIDPREMRLTPGWAVGSYFIPLVNLVLPCVALCQASRASGKGTGLVILWWLLSIFQILGLMALGILFVRSVTPEMVESGDFSQPDGTVWAGALSELVVVWVGVTMVLGITRAQREWREG